jgi:uncharacterized Zn finger protein (UPF0148 family)
MWLGHGLSRMEIRGARECSDCGTRWSYYETGEIECPSCGSIRSVGVDEPAEHTAGTAELDLLPVRAMVDDEPLREVADSAAEECRSYLRSVGFVHAGDLQPLGDSYLVAMELRRVGATLGRLLTVDDEEELYFLSLLNGAERGDRPEPTAVPETFHPERGLAVTAAVESYLGDLRRVLGDDREPAVVRVLSGVTARRKRIEALDGAVDPAEAEQLVGAVRDLSAFVREGDEAALARADERFDAESS